MTQTTVGGGVAVKLDRDLWARLKELAQERKQSLMTLNSEAVEAYLNKEERGK